MGRLFNGTPRDVNRIEPLLHELSTLWKRYPDMRFNQLIDCINGDYDGDIFNMEDDEFKKKLVLFNE